MKIEIKCPVVKENKTLPFTCASCLFVNTCLQLMPIPQEVKDRVVVGKWYYIMRTSDAVQTVCQVTEKRDSDFQCGIQDYFGLHTTSISVNYSECNVLNDYVAQKQ